VAAHEVDPRRNFVLGVANGALVVTGMSFIHFNMVMPGFLLTLTDRKAWIGVVSGLYLLGWMWPQIITASVVESRPRKKPFYVASAIARASSFAVFLIVLFAAGDGCPRLLLATTVVFAATLSLAGGLGMVPFIDIVSKAVPPRRRGRFFGARYFLGGIGAMVAGVIVKAVLANGDGALSAADYAPLFVSAAVISCLGLASFCMIDEPIRPVQKRRLPFFRFLRRGIRIFRRDRTMRRFVLVAWLIRVPLLLMPFYMVYARKGLGLPEDMAGVFLFVSSGAMTLSNLGWAFLSDHYGNRMVLLVSALGGIAMPLIVLSAHLAPHVPRLTAGGLVIHADALYYCLVFAIGGALTSGVALGLFNYQMEAAPEHRRPTYVSFQNTLMAPVFLILPLIGLVLDWTEAYRVVFAVAVLAAAVGAAAVLTLREPRHAPARRPVLPGQV